MVHINYIKKDPTTKIKSKTLKQLKVLKGKKFIDNKLFCYVKSDSHARNVYMSYCFI